MMTGTEKGAGRSTKSQNANSTRDFSSGRGTLRHSDDRFHTMADNIDQLAWMADEFGWTFWYNKRWLDYTGLRLENVRGWGWRAVHHPDHVDRVIRGLRNSFKTGEPREDTFPLRARDGSYRWFLSRAVPIRDDTGRIWRWFGTNTDVTEQHAAEEALGEANRRKDDFLALIGHELRNPMGSVLNAVRLLKGQGPDVPELKWCREVIERQVRQMARLVDDLMDVSRLGRGKLVLRKAVVDLAPVVERAIETTRPLLDERRHQLAITLPPRSLWLEVDPDRLVQILVNLLSNAAKYTEPEGKITLIAEAAGDWVSITVRDTGIGMSPDFIAQAFEMFRQADDASSQRQGGLGIGLSLVRSLVELHGGSVKAASAGHGRGSEFTVRLPLAVDPADTLPSPDSADQPQRPGRRILVVDDNVDAGRSLGRLLELEGHHVRIVHDGPQALAAFRQEIPDVVLLDLVLPGMDGNTIARQMRLRSRADRVTLVAMTGFGQEDGRSRSLDAGFDHYLIKPILFESLRAIIAPAVARPAAPCAPDSSPACITRAGPHRRRCQQQ